MSQTLIVHIIRTGKIPFVQSRAALPLMVMTAVIILIGMCIPFSPLASVIGLQPLPGIYFAWLVGACFALPFLRNPSRCGSFADMDLTKLSMGPRHGA